MSGLFKLPPRATRVGDSLLAQKTRRIKGNVGITIKGGGGLLERISTINAMVNKNLGKYKEQYQLIREEKELEKYIDETIKNGFIAIDTETDSLDPITCTIAGVCLYTPGNRGSYIPINHISYVTGIKIENQISEEFIQKQFQRLKDNQIKIIMFNAKFDIRVIKNQIGIELSCYWDGYLAARILNENEPANNLKALYNKYCLIEEEKGEFTYDTLFKGIPFTHIPINTGYLYGARDAEITYKLYEFQKAFLTQDDPICIKRGLQGPAYVFNQIEMPLINIVAEMEDNGIDFDFEFAETLSKKYTEKLKNIEDQFYNECDKFKEDIEKYRLQTGMNCKLKDPINIASPIQMAILLYDILKIDPPDKSKPRGTGEEILKKIKHPISDLLLEYREVAKLLSTYIDKMPESVNPKTGRIHTEFNQIGADTGRFSSAEPNMQNIPSQNKEIRKMFRATDGYVLLSSDYSAQEPRLTAHMSGDEKMIKAYKEDKDLYSEMASLAFNVSYEDCLKTKSNGAFNPKGHERREQAKLIFLGICYGKGVRAIGEDLKISTKKAQEIYDSVLKVFTGLKQFMIDSENMAREFGFVETLWGRKRRLPNMQLPPYEFEYVGGVPRDFDPLFNNDFEELDFEVDEDTKQRYTLMLDRAYNWKSKIGIIERAKKEGIAIKDNGGYIAEAKRQCVNSRIQGSAADQTKKAMILIGNDERLKKLGFRLLLVVHDELIGECPKENVKEVSEIFKQLMIDAAKELVVPSKCDIEITNCWYGEHLEID